MNRAEAIDYGTRLLAEGLTYEELNWMYRSLRYDGYELEAVDLREYAAATLDPNFSTERLAARFARWLQYMADVEECRRRFEVDRLVEAQVR